MADPTTERLFFALWPDPAVSTALAAAGRAAPAGDGRVIPPERIHLTLAFLGNVDGPGRACLEAAAGRVTPPPFELVLRRTGWWRRSRVMWAGPEVVPPELTLLVGRLREVVGGCGLAVESRPFAAHVTLARNVRRGSRGVLEPPIRWPVDGFALVRSVTDRHGPHYTTVARWPLTGG